MKKILAATFIALFATGTALAQVKVGVKNGKSADTTTTVKTGPDSTAIQTPAGGNNERTGGRKVENREETGKVPNGDRSPVPMPEESRVPDSPNDGRTPVPGPEKTRVPERAPAPSNDNETGKSSAFAKVPPGHYPPAGMCRIWHADVPPGKQPPPVTCAELQGVQLPPGSFVVSNHDGSLTKGNGKSKGKGNSGRK